MLTAQIRANDPSAENTSEQEIYNISFATEQPVRRFDFEIGEYYEILLCSPENVDLTRLNSGTGTLLYNHNWDNHVGGIKTCTVDADKVCRADVQFSDYGIGPEIKGKVLEGTLQGVSFGYEILEYKITGSDLFATKWAPYEISIVTVPADITVGLGRAMPVDEEEEQTEAVDNPAEENLENESTEPESTEPAEPDAPAVEPESESESESDAGENTSDTGESTTVEESAEADEKDPESVQESETESESKQADDLSNKNINTDNTDGEKPSEEQDPAATAEDDEKEIRAMADAYKLTRTATDELLSQFAQGESLENIRGMIRSGNITTKNNNNKGTTMTTASQILRNFISGQHEGLTIRNGRAVVPFNALRAAASLANPNQAVLDATDYRPDLFIDAVIGRSALANLNPQIFTGLSTNLDIPCEVPGADVGWLTDDGEAPADYEPKFTKIHLAKRYLGSRVPMSRAFVDYANPAVDKVGEMLIKRASKTIEKKVFSELSTLVVAANKATATTADVDAKILAAISKIGGYHDNLKIVMNTETLGEIRQVLVGSNTSGRYMYDDTNGKLRGVDVVTSPFVPVGDIFVGAWDQLIIGQWGEGFELRTVESELTGGYVVFVFAEVDFKIANADTAFHKVTMTVAP